MSTMIDSARDIPSAPYYVCANDRFMSGWGQSYNRTNVVIVPCDTAVEAVRVFNNLLRRNEMRYVRLNMRKPRLQTYNTYSLFDRDSASAWYK